MGVKAYKVFFSRVNYLTFCNSALHLLWQTLENTQWGKAKEMQATNKTYNVAI